MSASEAGGLSARRACSRTLMRFLATAQLAIKLIKDSFQRHRGGEDALNISARVNSLGVPKSSRGGSWVSA